MTKKMEKTTKLVFAAGAIASSIGESRTGIKTAMGGGNFVVDAMCAGPIQRAIPWRGGTPWSDCER